MINPSKARMIVRRLHAFQGCTNMQWSPAGIEGYFYAESSVFSREKKS